MVMRFMGKNGYEGLLVRTVIGEYGGTVVREPRRVYV